MKKISLISLGCPKNLVDSEAMLGQLVSKGYTISGDPADSEIIVINTCGFIEPAKKESIETILEAAQYKKNDPAKKLIVAGCLVQRYGAQLKAELPEVDHFVTLNDVERIVEACGTEFEERLENRPADYIYDGKVRRLLTTQSYAYLKIAEGCDHVCSFCAIPSMRGIYRSRTIASICNEASEIAQQGVKELILISQDSTIYGWDLGLKDGLAILARELCKIESVEWIRILYCYPTSLRNSFLDVMAEENKICSYIDMPLQHASGNILARMKRGGNSAQYRRMIDNIRKRVPDAAIRTTFIVGYPGETDKDFSELLHFVEDVEFDRVGAFLYSDEEGTTAFEHAEKIPAGIKKERKQELMALQTQISRKRNRALIGKTMRAIVDGERNELLVGRIYSQAPEIDGIIKMEGDSAAAGEFLDVVIRGAGTYDLSATVEPAFRNSTSKVPNS